MPIAKFMCYLAFTICLFSCTIPEQIATKQEATEFAKKLERFAKKRMPNFFSGSLSINGLSKRVEKLTNTSSLSFTSKEIKASIKSTDIGKNMLTTMAKDGTFELVKVYEKNNKMRAIFRLFSSEGGFNYYDLELIKEENEIKIADFYVYSSGENFSETLASLMNAIDKHQKRYGEDNISIDLTSIKADFKNGNFISAWENFSQLPYEIQKTKAAQLMKIEISKQISDSAYNSTLDDFEDLFKSDSSVALVLLDNYVINKEYTKAIAAIDKLDATINTDPFLDYMRGLLYYSNNNIDKSIAYHEKLIAVMPNFKKAYEELIAIYAEKDKSKANYYLEKYSKIKGVEANDIETFKTYIDEQ